MIEHIMVNNKIFFEKSEILCLEEIIEEFMGVLDYNESPDSRYNVSDKILRKIKSLKEI